MTQAEEDELFVKFKDRILDNLKIEIERKPIGFTRSDRVTIKLVWVDRVICQDSFEIP